MKALFDKPLFEETQGGAQTPERGVALLLTQSDRIADVGRYLTPDRIDLIMQEANQGDTINLYKLSSEIEERNHVLRHALETRIAAVQAVPWSIEPAAKTPEAERIADELRLQLEEAGSFSFKDEEPLDNMRDLIGRLTAAVLAGRSFNEIVWGEGGALLGFKFVPTHAVRYSDPVRMTRPLLVTETGDVAIPQYKMIVRRMRSPSGDPARAGLIRTIAWLHCFLNLNIKDLLSFIERYGMPFLVAKIDQATWDKERNKIKQLIRNFGSSGGALFTRNTEFELLQAANNTGDVYFKLCDYAEKAIEKLILGQLAASGEAKGLSGGDAQSQVRADLRDADCVEIQATINAQFIAPWMLFNHAASKLKPKFILGMKPKRDTKELSETVSNLHNAGLELDAEEASELFEMTLTRAVAPAPTPFLQPPADIAMSAEGSQVRARELRNFATQKEQRASNQRGAEVLPSSSLLSPLVSSAFNSVLSSSWASKLIDEIDAALADDSGEALKTLGQPEDLNLFDNAPLVSAIAGTSYAAAANGIAARAAQIGGKA